MSLPNVIAEFYMHPVRQGAASEAAGRDIYKDVEYVRILYPGDNTQCHETPVTDKHRSEFAEVYRKWKENGQIVHEGTPLDSWPAMTPARIREMNALNIFTVEHIAGLDDSRIQRVGMGARELKKQAEAFLAVAKDSGAAQGYALEVERLKIDNAALAEQVKVLAAKLEAAIKKETI